MNHLPKNPNPLVNISFNVIIPALILSKSAKWFGLSPSMTVAIALAFPFFYGLFDLLQSKKINPLSILGLVSVLLSGGISLLELPKEYIAIKEASIPIVIALVILISVQLKYPLLKKLLLNENLINTHLIAEKIQANNASAQFESLFYRATYFISFSFVLSAVLNFAVAKHFIRSPTGTQAFAEELGRMTFWSYFIIAIPCTIVLFITLFYLFRGIHRLTGLSFDDIVKEK